MCASQALRRGDANQATMMTLEPLADGVASGERGAKYTLVVGGANAAGLCSSLVSAW